MKVTHVINSLNNGGAENMLKKLVLNRTQQMEYSVITLIDKGELKIDITNCGIEVISFNSKWDYFNPIKWFKIISLIMTSDIVVSWLYAADLFSFFVAKLLCRKKLIWNIRHTSLEKHENSFKTYILSIINANLSKYVDAIVFCANSSKTSHQNKRFSMKRYKIIPNGFVLDEITYNDSYKLYPLNKKLKIIYVGRWNMLKGYNYFLEALSKVKEVMPSVQADLYGTNIDNCNYELISLIKYFSLERIVNLKGVDKNIKEKYCEYEMLVSASISEGFSNVIGEAMAAKLLCVVTDVGDATYLVSELEQLVEKANSNMLANKIIEFASMDITKKQELRHKSRKKIEDFYCIHKVIGYYEEFFLEIGGKISEK